jgi:hypothetical protein
VSAGDSGVTHGAVSAGDSGIAWDLVGAAGEPASETAWLVVLNRSPYSYAGRRPLDLLGEGRPQGHAGRISRFRSRPARSVGDVTSASADVTRSTADGLVAVRFDRLAVALLATAGAVSALSSRGAVRGRHIRAFDVEERLVVTAPSPVPAQVDGEYVGRAERFEFTYDAAAITVVQPPRRAGERHRDSR